MDTTTKQILLKPGEYLDQEVTLTGWVKSIRNSKDVNFIEFNDGSCFKNLQIVFSNNLSNFAKIEKVTLGSSLAITGIAKESHGKEQSIEVQATTIEIIGLADASNPIQKKRHSFEYLRTIAHLRPRTNTFLAVFRVRSLVAKAIHDFFQSQDFVYVHTPIITGTDAEGAGEMFRVTTLPSGKENPAEELLGKNTFLTVSGQLSVESFCFAYRNVYTFGPTFRAENSNTARHAAEFWMIEPEMAFADLKKNMKTAEALVKYIIKYLLDNAPDEIKFFNDFIEPELLSRLTNLVNSEFGAITYTEAIKLLEESKVTFENKPSWGSDLTTEHERYLAEVVFQKPIFVTDYPKEFKAFYMRMNDDGKTVRAMDLLVPGVGEIIGGSQREERLDILEQRMKECHMDPEEYNWYLDTRRFGTFPHAGFGLGFERIIMYLTGMKNIRDVLPYPRTPNNALY
jgi:asparaginyl-tRNA synthetase